MTPAKQHNPRCNPGQARKNPNPIGGLMNSPHPEDLAELAYDDDPGGDLRAEEPPDYMYGNAIPDPDDPTPVPFSEEAPF